MTNNQTGPTGATILVVDDRPANLLALEAGLGRQGYGLRMADSGPEALRLSETEDFAAVLLDVQMPGMDGFQTAQLLRQKPRSRHTPIIFLTANYPNEESVMQGYEAGAVDYLIKPLNMGVLRAKVGVFVELYRNRLRIAELERRQAEKRYQNLVEGIRDGIVWVADREMKKFSFVSRYAQRITGYSTESWQNEESFWDRHLHPDDKERVRRAFARIAMDHEPFVLEHRFVKPGGETIWLHTGVHEDRIEGGPADLRGLSVDITHLKETERALRDAIRARDEFLSIASHELRTPITPLQLQMQGFVRLVQLGKLEHLSLPRLTEMIEISEAQVSRLARLISQLLDVSRLNAGRFHIELERTNLSDLIRGVVDGLTYEIKAAECELKLDLDDGVYARVDRPRFEQVVVNLMTNALKYGPGKPIEITLRATEHEARLSVVDHGIGVEPKDQNRIFNQFERAVSAHHYGGLGLGLYISGQIVELHRGRIWVESKPGRGASFFVAIPL